MTANLLLRFLFGRRERRAEESERERMTTAASGVTLFRGAVVISLLGSAIIQQSETLLLVGLGSSLVLDFADGALARACKAETVLGAQLDGEVDRIATVFVIAAVVSMHPDLAVSIAAGLVWVQFGMIDHLLATQFLRFGIWSPDHFHELDDLDPGRAERVWLLNWSAGAKLASNITIVLLAVGATSIAAGISLALIAIRAPGYLSIRKLARLMEEREGESSHRVRRGVRARTPAARTQPAGRAPRR